MIALGLPMKALDLGLGWSQAQFVWMKGFMPILQKILSFNLILV